MPGYSNLAIKNFHPRDEFINFNEETHTYKLTKKDGYIYIFPRSVSSFVKTFFKQFDSKNIIETNILKWKKDSSSKYNRFLSSVEKEFPLCNLYHQGCLIAEAWKLNGERQSSLGTKLHLKIEKFLNNQEEEYDNNNIEENKDDNSIPDISNISKDDYNKNLKIIHEELISEKVFRLTDYDAMKLIETMCKKFYDPIQYSFIDNKDIKENNYNNNDINSEFESWKRWKSQNSNLIPYRTEWSIYSEEHDIAGQIDAIFIDKNTNEFILVDWKRVLNMEYESSSPFQKEKFGKYPFEKIPDTNFGHYTLQVNLYEMILKKFYNINIHKKLLVQIHPSIPYPGYIEHIVCGI
jgi:hypothetical protein